MRLDGALPDEEMSGQFRVTFSGGQQLQDLSFSLGETTKLNVVAAMGRLANESFNDLTGDRGCQKGIAGSNDAHCMNQFFGRGIRGFW
jgi:hypothetical protein